MRIYLSALGWVDDAPRGHRLRWHYPVRDVVAEGGYLGLPKRIVIERASLDSHDFYHSPLVSSRYPSHPMASSLYPDKWWEPQPDISVFGFVPPYAYTLPAPVQAIRFNYHGSPARIVVGNSAGEIAYDALVRQGDSVYVEASMIDTVHIYATLANLVGIYVLDLFKSHGLQFEPIAELEVAATYESTLATVAPRYDQSPTLSTEEWNELVDAVKTANATLPSTEQPGEPMAWDNALLVLALRWEFALLGGFAFFDGSRDEVCVLDHLGDNILKELPRTFMAYRVRDVEGLAGHSNLVVCAPWPATALAPPNAPWYVNPEVRLRQSKTVLADHSVLGKHASLTNYTPQLTFEGDYTVHTMIGWQHNDARALGVEIEEVQSASTATGATESTTRFMSRSRRLNDSPGTGLVARDFDVSFIDVLLRSRARAIDAWDRASDYSLSSPITPLALRHEPLAPPLESATYHSGTIHIQRAIGRPGIPDWYPDPIVKHTAGNVYIYRRTVSPRTANSTVSRPWPVSAGLYRVNISGSIGLSDFVGGTLSVGAFSDTIVAASESTIDFAVPDNGTPVTLFDAGAARLSQDPLMPSLWKQVATFAAVDLPEELKFSEELPAASGLVIDSYSIRIAFMGRLGPFGNVVTAIRLPDVPVVPPPFTVDVLGIDFYRRTMIKLRFTTPPTEGRYTIWWADGDVAPEQFPRRGAAGTHGAQHPTNGDVLYDLLPLPIPIHVNRTVTIGVQRVLDGGVQGDFVILSLLLPAMEF